MRTVIPSFPEVAHLVSSGDSSQLMISLNEIYRKSELKVSSVRS